MRWTARDELAGINVGNFKLKQRIWSSVAVLEAAPDVPYPKAVDAAGREGWYRLLGNEDVTPMAALEPHIEQTLKRASAIPDVLALHDTTEICHAAGSQGEDFYSLQNGKYGYLAHHSLLVAEEDGMPLGVANLLFVERDPERAPRVSSKKTWLADDKESRRWLTAVEAIQARLPRVVHVMDREGDSYELLCRMVEKSCRFVVRGRTDRNVKGKTGKLLQEIGQAAVVATREVDVSERKKQRGRDKKSHPERKSRVATLTISARGVVLKRPKHLPGTGEKGLPTTIRVNVVCVEELNPPEGQPPVRWILHTSESIDTPEQITRIVDIYTRRWLIEELFKSLKTGCAFEKRQLESLKTSQTALALTLPIAFNVLRVRHVARTNEQAPADTVISEQELKVLRAITRIRLPPKPTAGHIMAAIAALGGHIKSNGPPGWLVLGRGMQHLAQAIIVWELAQNSQAEQKTRRSDR